MNDVRAASTTLWVAAGATLLIGVLLLLSSWDGLYESLDLPQPTPALAAQIGGAALVGLAYVLWGSAGRPAMVDLAAVAGAIAHGGGALVIAVWLVFRNDELDEQFAIDTLGTVILIVTAVVLAGLALAQLRLALGSRRLR